MALHLFCNQVTAVRFCHGAPVFSRVSLVVKLVVWDHGSEVRFFHPRPVFWAVSDNGSTLALHVRGKSSILLRSTKICRINSVVECFVANENVIGSNPISCSKVCLVNSVVECLFYTEKVGSSNLSRGTKIMESNAGELVPRPALKTGFCRNVDGVRLLCSPPIYPIGEMNITQCYERWVGSLILSLGAKLGRWAGW